ncbi:MAG: hypothetical protein JWO38_6850 [Gemmataceae bacterium]|nr:hypothetical protein [Gemmataceae bacterium]
MHADAYQWLARMAALLPPRTAVCEMGSRDVNGTPRSLFPALTYVGVDAVEGPGVDVVADAETWRPAAGGRFDAVLCTEMLEHTRDGGRVCRTAAEILLPGGVLLITAATAGRHPHSAVDGGQLREGEWYQNIDPAVLRVWLRGLFPAVLEVHSDRGDLYCLAVKLA